MSNNDSRLVEHLHTTLQQLSANNYPVLENPESTKKRASVALVLRVQPSYSHWPTADAARPNSLEAFFEQEWVQHGDPETLFIKRAARKGDRWTSHIALPGGKRDPSDEDDKAAAIRETSEEVGIDLNAHAVEVGNLPQRLVTTHWGKKPLMILCPYIFLITTHNLPPLHLQPTEVASTHWVPLRSLLSPAQRTVSFEDVSSRLTNQETGIKKWMLQAMLGKMLFAAINIVPSESLHSFETPAYNSPDRPQTWQPSLPHRAWYWLSHFNPGELLTKTPPPTPHDPPLLLWGLTLGVIADFLDLLPPHNALELWTYPTFTPLDVKLTIWALTYKFKHRKRAELQAGTQLPTESQAGSVETLPGDGYVPPKERPDETGLHGLGTGVESPSNRTGKRSAVATMLEGCVERVFLPLLPSIDSRGRYYDIVRRAVAVALIGRASLLAIFIVLAWRRWRSR